MTDRELLEAAAKAIGREVTFRRNEMCVFRNAASLGPAWDPLADDGDALRLAVELKLGVAQFPFDEAHVQWDHGVVMEDHNGNPAAATRRAIVRAAAALAPPEETP